MWILDRLKEKTTWAGIVLIASVIAGFFSPEFAEQITVAGGTIIGGIFVVRKDNDTKPTV